MTIKLIKVDYTYKPTLDKSIEKYNISIESNYSEHPEVLQAILRDTGQHVILLSAFTKLELRQLFNECEKIFKNEEEGMKNLKVVKVNSDFIEFKDGIRLYSEHIADCCENHYLNLSDLTIDDFTDLEFDLTDKTFFKRIDGYGIELIPKKGHPIRIAGHGYNNGYYSSHLTLIISKGENILKTFDISECQNIEG